MSSENLIEKLIEGLHLRKCDSCRDCKFSSVSSVTDEKRYTCRLVSSRYFDVKEDDVCSAYRYRGDD